MQVSATPEVLKRVAALMLLACPLFLLTAYDDLPAIAKTPETPHPGESPEVAERLSRIDALPHDAVKITPDTDSHSPILHSDEFHTSEPVSGGVKTAGAEDSAFVTPDGTTMYFFFPPDVRVPPEQQIIDGVTGIYVSHVEDGTWSEAERVVLQDPDKLALDGAPFVLAKKCGLHPHETEGWPFISEGGRELWFTRTHLGTPAVFRAFPGPTGWEEPELIVSQFAAEPTLDRRGNLYFVHHYFRNGQMLEADIYVSRRK